MTTEEHYKLLQIILWTLLIAFGFLLGQIYSIQHYEVQFTKKINSVLDYCAVASDAVLKSCRNDYNQNKTLNNSLVIKFLDKQNGTNNYSIN
jgi:hypothetical protein